MRRKTLALALVLVLFLGLFPLTVQAAGTAESAGWIATELVPLGKYDFIDQGDLGENYFQFSDGLAMVQMNGKYGYIDKAGVEVIPCKYDWGTDFSEGFAFVELDGTTKRIDKTDAEFGSYNYELGSYLFSEDLISVKRNGKWGYIDKTGKEVIPCELDYQWVDDFFEGFAWVGDENFLMGCIDKTGAEVVPCKYYMIRAFNETLEGLALVEKGIGQRGFIDKTGVEVIPCNKYTIIDIGSSEGLAKVCSNNKWGYIDKTGTEVVPCKYDSVSSFSEGLAGVRSNKKWGYINKAGAEIIPCKYDDVYSFSEDLAAVKLNNKWGFIDKAGTEVIPCKYDDVNGFYNSFAEVRVGDWETGRWGLIDKTGAEVLPCRYGDITGFDSSLGLCGAWLDGKLGFFDVAGREVIPCTFVCDSYTFIEDGLVCVTRLHSDSSARGGFVAVDYGLLSIAKNAGESPKPVAVTGVSVAKTASVQVGKTKTLTATVKPFNAANKGVYWASDDTYVVSVDTNGKITGVKEGEANVTATTVDGGFTATCAVTVTKATSSIGGGGGGGSVGGGGGGAATTKPSAQPSAQPSAKPVDTAKPASEVFTDVVKGSWYEAGVTYVVQKGLFNGVADKTFAPQQNMTRAMLVTVLARLDGQDTNGGANWYAKGADWAKAQGISDGTLLDQSVTREQLVTMLYRYAKATKVDGDLTKFTDSAKISGWAKDAMTWAVAKGILTGKDGRRLDPQGTATRAEVATILQRFVEKK